MPLPGSDSTIICGRVRDFQCENCHAVQRTYSATKMFCDSQACQEAKRERNLLLGRKRHAKAKRSKK